MKNKLMKGLVAGVLVTATGLAFAEPVALTDDQMDGVSAGILGLVDVGGLVGNATGVVGGATGTVGGVLGTVTGVAAPVVGTVTGVAAPVVGTVTGLAPSVLGTATSLLPSVGLQAGAAVSVGTSLGL